MKNIRGLPLNLDRRRWMRRNPTAAEDYFWNKIRNKKLDGFRFRRQHSIGYYIVDFYCDELALAIKIDGAIHQNPDQLKKDQRRTKWIQSVGHHMLRFTNDEVLFDTQRTLEKLRQTLQEIRSQRTSPSR